MTAKTDKLLTDAIQEKAEYCINCKHSYLSEETGSGYCGFSKKGKPKAFPKSIKEFDTCPHWSKKK